jgi:hypothetical protein
MTIVHLEDVFTKDEVNKLRERVAAALENDSTAVLVGGGEIFATLMGPQAIRDAVHQRVLSKLIEDPKELDRLKARFESDDLVQ